MPSPGITPEEAKEITRLKQAEADDLSARINRVVRSLKRMQKENGFAPRLAATYGKVR